MDGSRFDGFVRALTARTTRRRALLELAGSALASLLSLARVEETSAACVKPGKLGCKGPRNGKCCDGARCTRGNKDHAGRCVCLRSLKQCGRDCVNTKNDPKHCGRCNKRCAPGHSCKSGRCTSKLGCKAGQHFCSNGVVTPCPRTSNPNCLCITDVHGTPRCVDGTVGDCSDCTRNADCGPDMVCFRADSGACKCHEQPPSNGNACFLATCGGKT
jgi:hypothetical protein